MTWMGFLVGSSRLFWASWHSLVVSYAGYNRIQSHKAGAVATNIAQLSTIARAGFSQGYDGSTELHDGDRSLDEYRGVFPTDMVRRTTQVDSWGMP